MMKNLVLNAKIMRKNQKIFYVLLFLVPYNLMNSQSCDYPINTTPPQTTSSGCLQFLNDFVPNSIDPVLEVKVNMYIFMPGNNNGAWGNTSNNAARAQVALDIVNDIYSTIPQPNLILNNSVPNRSHVKIRLVLNNFQRITNTALFDHPDNAISYPAYNSLNEINVYYGNCVNCIAAAHVPSLDPKNYVTFHDAGSNSDIASNVNGAFLAHEVGHVLGLDEVFGSYSSISNITDGCCSSIAANDYVLETLPITNWGTIPCDPSATNNLMSAPICFEYLSPHQMAIMQYHLRTDYTQLLTANSYNVDIASKSLSDYNVTTNEIWTVDRYFKGNITVKAGRKLEVRCKLGMTKNAVIIVEKNAQLIIGNGGHVTNISGQLWGGVLVQGSSNLAQVVNNTTGFATNQGVLRIINGGKISQAENGAKNYTNDSQGNIDWASIGGVIIGNGGIFENNIRDVEFLSYQNPQGNDFSSFTNCIFRTKNTFNSINSPYAHVSMWNVKGIQFRGCTFEYTAGNKYNNPGIGIHSIDAIYYVDKNGTTPSTFNDLAWGIRVDNVNPLKAVNVSNSVFNNNLMDAAYYKNTNNFIFHNNTINLSHQFWTYGVYAYSCKGYQIKNNQFLENTTQLNKASIGVCAFNSKAGSHQIYNNIFSNLEQGISAIGNNSGTTNTTNGLVMNCNDFTSVSNKWDIAMVTYTTQNSNLIPPTVATKQGDISTSNVDPYKLVRNRYGAPSTSSTSENKWYIQGTSVKTINHGSNASSSANTHPIPQPQNSDIAVNDQAVGPAFNISQCPTNPGAGGGINPSTSKLTAINNYLLYLFENNEGNRLRFDIEATLGEKINYFVSDSLPESKDSVISIIASNQTRITDADILLVYAYINKGDYQNASNAVENISSNRIEYKNLLTELIALYSSTNMLYNLKSNTQSVNFLESYATNDTIDGQEAAQSALTFIMNQTFTDPRLHPDPNSTNYRLINKNKDESTTSIFDNSNIKVYPNPSRNEFYVDIATENNSDLTLEIKDILGRVIFTKGISSSSIQYISTLEWNCGIYILSVLNSKNELIHKSKIIKQD